MFLLIELLQQLRLHVVYGLVIVLVILVCLGSLAVRCG
jgi:hypothetical protein